MAMLNSCYSELKSFCGLVREINLHADSETMTRLSHNDSDTSTTTILKAIKMAK